MLSRASGAKEEVKQAIPLPVMVKEVSLPEELRRSQSLDNIEKITIGSKGLATFAYIADQRNPPVPKGEKVYIVGELTKGKLVELQPIVKDGKTLYYVKLKVDPGFKYTFCFKLGTMLITDTHYPMYRTKFGYASPRKKS